MTKVLKLKGSHKQLMMLKLLQRMQFLLHLMMMILEKEVAKLVLLKRCSTVKLEKDWMKLRRKLNVFKGSIIG